MRLTEVSLALRPVDEARRRRLHDVTIHAQTDLDQIITGLSAIHKGFHDRVTSLHHQFGKAVVTLLEKAGDPSAGT